MKELFNVTIDDYEKRILVLALDKLKDSQELAEKHYDFIDGIIIKIDEAPRAKERFRWNAKEKER